MVAIEKGGGGGSHGIPEGQLLGTLALVRFGRACRKGLTGRAGWIDLLHSSRRCLWERERHQLGDILALSPVLLLFPRLLIPSTLTAHIGWRRLSRSTSVGLATVELATAYPTDGGVAVWAALAFNEFWGFMGGYFSLVEGVVNLAVFPTVTLDYILVLFDVS
eukprot:308859-Hanusia_phi.AAC.6